MMQVQRREDKLHIEALERQLKAEVKRRSDLEDQIVRNKQDSIIDLRERIATEVHRQGWDADTASAMFGWVISEPAKPLKSTVKKRRKYTKRSKVWKKRGKKS
jgi:hypothetical protein